MNKIAQNSAVKYKFTEIDDSLFSNLTINQKLSQWGLSELNRLKYRFNLEYYSFNTEIFIKNLLKNKKVQEILKIDNSQEIQFKFRTNDLTLLNINFLDWFYENSMINRNLKGNWRNI